MYLSDIGQYELLTKDDEARLAQAIEAGTAAAKELEEGGTSVSPARKRELRRLVRAGEDVAPRENGGNGGSLDGGGFGVAVFRDGAHEFGV